MSAVLCKPPVAGPLNAEHHAALASANERARQIRRAAGVAGFNGWVTGIFAVCSAPFAPFSLAGFLVTVGLAVVAYNEFQGRRKLLQFDRTAPRLLGWNQLGFLAIIVVYCGWMLHVGLSSEGPFAAEVKAHPELGEALGQLEEFDGLYRLLVVAVYVSVAVLSVIFQGGNAIYYFTRRKPLEAYLHQTPPWVLDVQRLAANC